ncbi:MAG: 7-carboxy-7-deazaguanine synthase [Myxococcales bacterium]|nr:7-carboxy-7-deazaguanine synthase [Myxococcales bacterium]MCB9717631.1 7-carboxy-7-deazaguanine synthase [Myxococcales bacterium]
MTYRVKEIYATLQGEGAHAGRSAVFCRFSGCNLWSGRERDRDRAVCRFCDTDFVGTDGARGGEYSSPESLVEVLAGLAATDYVVFTGGEPLLQLDAELVDHCHRRGLTVAVETNGTMPAPAGIDWICVSPKAGAPLRQRRGSELKLVYPQPELLPERLADLEFEHFFLQPMDGPQRDENTQRAAEYCLRHPRWRLSLQTHKLIGLP